MSRSTSLCRLFAVALLSFALASRGADASMFKVPDPSRDLELGRQVAKEYERTHRLTADSAAQARVQRVGRALADAVEPKLYPYQFKVVAEPEVNARAYPGGLVYVHEALLAYCPDDDMLAAVLAHEVAHAAHRHWAHSMTKLQDVAILGVIASIFAGDKRGNIANLTVGLTQLRYSRKDENDADRTALDYMDAAGFDLQGAVRLMQLLATLDRSGAPKWLRNHPRPADRLQRIREHIGEIELVKKQNGPSVAQLSTPTVAPVVPTVGAGTEVSPVASACGDTTGLQIAPNEWFPLAAGNEWTYAVSGGAASYTLRIIGCVSVAGGTVYRGETILAGSTVPCQVLTTADAVWRRNRPSSPDSPWSLQNVVQTAEPVTRDGWQYAVVGKEPVEVPCGRFPVALHVRKESGTPKQICDEWFVSGVGLVRRVDQVSGITETLIRYQLAPSGGGAPERPPLSTGHDLP